MIADTHTHMHWLYISPIYPLCIPMLIEVARKKFQSQGACGAIEWAPDSSPAGSLAQLFLQPFALNRSTHCCLQAMAENLQKRHTLLRDVAERTLVFALLEYNPNRSCEPLSNLVNIFPNLSKPGWKRASSSTSALRRSRRSRKDMKRKSRPVHFGADSMYFNFLWRSKFTGSTWWSGECAVNHPWLEVSFATQFIHVFALKLNCFWNFIIQSHLDWNCSCPETLKLCDRFLSLPRSGTKEEKRAAGEEQEAFPGL